MTNVVQLQSEYMFGTLQLTKLSNGRFCLVGNWNRHTANHGQLIYGALEIASNSNDPFALQFRAMCHEYLKLTADWAD